MTDQRNQSLKCHFCKAEEGKVRPVGDYVVKLTRTLLESESILVCQSCFRKRIRSIKNKMTKRNTPKKTVLKLKNLLGKLVVVSFFNMITVAVIASPPGLPGGPVEAPIDGGLGLLAAAGGAYAIKKLRDKKV